VLVRKDSKTLALDNLQVERVNGDLRDRESLARALEGADQVYHCAASVSQWRPNLKSSCEINVNGTINVLEESLNAKVKRVVYVSTVDTLGLSSLENPADENWPEHESMAKFHNPYVETKYEAEQEAKKFSSQGLDLVIVKPTYMIGEWDAKPSSGQMIVQVAKGRAAAYPGGGNNFVDVLDVCEGMRLAMEKGKSGEIYILANDRGNMTYKDFFTLVAKTVGKSPPKFQIPYPAAVMAGYVFDMLGKMLGFEPDVNSVTAKMGYAPHYFTCKKAIRELGIPQSPIEGAVKRAFAWFTKHGYL
jgi:dihydroflavonol-4-reductase